MIRPPATSAATLSLTLVVALASLAFAPAATARAASADRYGPSSDGSAVASLVAPTAAAAAQPTAYATPMAVPPEPPRLRGLLTWPGKTDAPVALRAAALRDAAPGREADRREVEAARETLRRPSDRRPWNRRPWDRRLANRSHPAEAATQVAAMRAAAPQTPPEAVATENAPVRSLPTSIYDSPGPQAGPRVVAMAARSAPPPTAGQPQAEPQPPRQVAAASATRPRQPYGEGVRFYSVHRQYGLTPDRDPIPPQFFATTADLTPSDPAQPDGPLPNRRVLTGSGGSALAQRSAAEAENASSSQP